MLKQYDIILLLLHITCYYFIHLCGKQTNFIEHYALNDLNISAQLLYNILKTEKTNNFGQMQS